MFRVPPFRNDEFHVKCFLPIDALVRVARDRKVEHTFHSLMRSLSQHYAGTHRAEATPLALIAHQPATNHDRTSRGSRSNCMLGRTVGRIMIKR